MRKAVFDSSSLIFSLKLPELLELLKKRFDSFSVPANVFEEVVAGGQKKGAPEVSGLKRLVESGELKIVYAKPLAAEALGAGEAEALAFARQANAVCLSDDRKAYSVGAAVGIEVLSLSAFLVGAARKKLISSERAESLLSRLVESGYYLKTADYLEVLKAIRRK